MSIYFSGGFTRSGGVVSAIGKQLKSINLKAISKINVSFDPFSENSISAREFLFHLSTPKIVQTNPNCTLKTNVLCGRQPSEVTFVLNDQAKAKLKSEKVKFLSDNLTTLELLELCNKHISVLAPVEDIKAKVLTKSEKKQAGGSRKLNRK